MRLVKRRKSDWLGYASILMLGALHVGSAFAEPEAVLTVRANRFAVYRGDAVFSSLDIAQAALSREASIDEALKSQAQAGLFRRSSSLTANPTVQGISLRAIAPSGAGRALVTLNGVPQNDPFGGWVIWAALPKSAIQSVHVVRGAGGGAYGAGSLTGVIDISLMPPEETRGYIQVEAGEGENSSLSFGGAAGGFSLHHVDQVLNGDVPIRGALRGAGDVATYGRDRVWLADWQGISCPLGFCGQIDIMAGRYDSRRDTGLRGATANTRGDQLSASFTHAPTPEGLGYRAQVWHKSSDLANRSVSISADRMTTTVANAQVATPATGNGLNLAIRHQTPTGEWEIGIDARASDGGEREYFRYVGGVASRLRRAGGKTSLAGIYTEGSQNQGDLIVTGSLRVDSWRAYDGYRIEIDTANNATVLQLIPTDRSGTVASARLGAALNIAQDTSIRLAAYNGFRPPSLNELYRPFRVGNDITEANADLKLETLYGLEMGYRQKWKGGLLDGDLFYNVVRDPITNVTLALGPGTFPVAGFIPAGGSYRQRQNLGRIDAYGLELQARHALTSAITLDASATVTHARVSEAGAIDGKHPAQAPEYVASLGLSRILDALSLSANVVMTGLSYEDDLNRLKMKPAQSLRLTAQYTLTTHVTLSASINNALNASLPIARSADGTTSYDNRRLASVALVWRQ